MGRDPFRYPRLLQALSSLTLDTSRDPGTATASLGTLCQGLPTLPGNNSFPISHPSLPSGSGKPFPVSCPSVPCPQSLCSSPGAPLSPGRTLSSPQSPFHPILRWGGEKGTWDKGQGTGNGFPLPEGRAGWDIGKELFWQDGQGWHRVPRAAVAAPGSLAVPKARLDIGAWSSLGQWEVSLPMAGVTLDEL